MGAGQKLPFDIPPTDVKPEVYIATAETYFQEDLLYTVNPCACNI